MPLLRAVVQLADFVVKACKAYAQTEAGQVELADIYQALAGDQDPEGDNPQNTEGK